MNLRVISDAEQGLEMPTKCQQDRRKIKSGNRNRIQSPSRHHSRSILHYIEHSWLECGFQGSDGVQEQKFAAICIFQWIIDQQRIEGLDALRRISSDHQPLTPDKPSHSLSWRPHSPSCQSLLPGGSDVPSRRLWFHLQFFRGLQSSLCSWVSIDERSPWSPTWTVFFFPFFLFV